MKRICCTMARRAAICFALMTASSVSYAGQLQSNQTEGFGAGKRLTLTYTQNYDCIDQPNLDLDFDKSKAAIDPDEMQIPICQVGINPTINPPGMVGKATGTTLPFYVLVPMFSVDNDQNPDDAIGCRDVTPGTVCGNTLGKTLISLFGALPEAFKAKPSVFTQCPEPGARPGTCTMHASRVDLAPVLAKLGYIPNPPTANVFVPTPNHSHVIHHAQTNLKPIWWQVIPVLVLDKADWPPQDGSSGITSTAQMRAAIRAGRAIPAPSNFFLYFSTDVASSTSSMGNMGNMK